MVCATGLPNLALLGLQLSVGGAVLVGLGGVLEAGSTSLGLGLEVPKPPASPSLLSAFT